MKKSVIAGCLIVAILLLCSCEPLFTTYGEIVHDAVKEHYSSYEILSLIRIEKTESLHSITSALLTIRKMVSMFYGCLRRKMEPMIIKWNHQ